MCLRQNGTMIALTLKCVRKRRRNLFARYLNILPFSEISFAYFPYMNVVEKDNFAKFLDVFRAVQSIVYYVNAFLFSLSIKPNKLIFLCRIRFSLWSKRLLCFTSPNIPIEKSRVLVSNVILCCDVNCKGYINEVVFVAALEVVVDGSLGDLRHQRHVGDALRRLVFSLLHIV